MSHPRLAFATKHMTVCLPYFFFLLFQTLEVILVQKWVEGRTVPLLWEIVRTQIDKAHLYSSSFPRAISTLFKLICVWGFFFLPLDWLQISSGIPGRGAQGSSRCTCRVLKGTWAIFLIASLLHPKGSGKVLKSKLFQSSMRKNFLKMFFSSSFETYRYYIILTANQYICNPSFRFNTPWWINFK